MENNTSFNIKEDVIMKGSVKENKKTGKYDIVFDIGKDPETGKRRQIKRRGFICKKEAEQALVKLKAEYLNDEHLKISSMTYGEFLDQFLEDRKSQLAKSSYVTNLRYNRSMIKPYLGHLKIQEITTLHLQRYASKLVENPRFSEATIHSAFRYIRTSFKRALALKLIKENPTTNVILPKITKKELRVWTLDELNYFLSTIKEEKYKTRYNIIYYVAALTGLRQGEILGLRWKDIDLENNLIKVRQTLTLGELKYGAKNNSSVRTIHIPNILVEELKQHRQLLEYEKTNYKYKYVDLGLALPSRHGTPMMPRNLLKAFHAIVEKTGLPRIRFHDFRHTHATLLLQQGINIKLISERLGHAKIQTTLSTYSHVLPEMQRTISDKLDEVFTKV
jgi:integrase